jgi:hypothetical protein
LWAPISVSEERFGLDDGAARLLSIKGEGAAANSRYNNLAYDQLPRHLNLTFVKRVDDAEGVIQRPPEDIGANMNLLDLRLWDHNDAWLTFDLESVLHRLGHDLALFQHVLHHVASNENAVVHGYSAT